MNTERDELVALLPPVTEVELPRAAEHRAALLAELASRPQRRASFSGWTAPALAAAALVLVVALTAAIGLFLDSDTSRTVSPAGSGPDPLSRLLDRLDALENPVGPPGGYPADSFAYVEAVRPDGTVNEFWYSVDGSKNSVSRFGEDVKGTEDPVPLGAGKDPLTALLNGTTLARMNAVRATYDPARFYDVLRDELRTPTKVFLRIQLLLQKGGLADPEVRLWLYRTAGLVPGVRFVSDRADAKGRHSPAIALTGDDGVERAILVNPATGALMAQTGDFQPQIGDPNYTYLAYGRSTGPEQAPEPVFRSEVVPLSALPDPVRSAVVPTSVRNYDFRNNAWELPLDLGQRPQVKAADHPGGPIANFTDGIARIPANDEWPLQFTIDPRRHPIVYVQPTPKQVGAADGPIPESAVVTIEIRPTDPADRGLVYYAVIGFAGTPGGPFPGPQALIELISGGVGPVVTATGDTVTVDSRRVPPKRYVRDGEGFAPAP